MANTVLRHCKENMFTTVLFPNFFFKYSGTMLNKFTCFLLEIPIKGYEQKNHVPYILEFGPFENIEIDEK